MTSRSLRILFVCSGNTCRSPMAEAIARDHAPGLDGRGVEVRSAGTSATQGRPASDGALRTARRHGLALEAHTSSPITPELIRWADLILTMGPAHLARVREMGGEGKSALLGAFAEGSDDVSEPAVPDPFGGDDRTYENTFQTLGGMVTASLGRLSKEGGQ